MAIESGNPHDTALFCLKGLGVSITVQSPLFFRDLLEQTLTGWEISILDTPNRPRIMVLFENGRFNIKTDLIKPVPSRSDLIDTLNEFFLCLAYLSVTRIKGAKLLHCAAFNEDKKNVVVFGKKNAGKSSLVLSKAQAGATILADDLLIWLPKSATVMCVGLPIRMRRPVVGLNKTSSDKPQFIAGKQIAYAQKDVFEIAGAGDAFTPDTICELADHEMTPVPFRQWPQIIAKHTISDDYTRVSPALTILDEELNQ